MGPTCGMILADLGAEVIKVEPPGGDKTRNLPALGIGFFRSFNRNKKSVVIDITTTTGRTSRPAGTGLAECDVFAGGTSARGASRGEMRARTTPTLSAGFPGADLRCHWPQEASLPTATASQIRLWQLDEAGPDDGRACPCGQAQGAARCAPWAPAMNTDIPWPACSAAIRRDSTCCRSAAPHGKGSRGSLQARRF
ncbi:CoA transferase [Cupriavidus basilensis]